MITRKHGPILMSIGQKMAKKRNPVYLIQPKIGGGEVEVDGSFAVETNEGVVTAKPGDYVAYDPISGHVWPVAASYVEQHYEPFDIEVLPATDTAVAGAASTPEL